MFWVKPKIFNHSLESRHKSIIFHSHQPIEEKSSIIGTKNEVFDFLTEAGDTDHNEDEYSEHVNHNKTSTVHNNKHKYRLSIKTERNAAKNIRYIN